MATYEQLCITIYVSYYLKLELSQKLDLKV